MYMHVMAGIPNAIQVPEMAAMRAKRGEKYGKTFARMKARAHNKTTITTQEIKDRKVFSSATLASFLTLSQYQAWMRLHANRPAMTPATTMVGVAIP